MRRPLKRVGRLKKPCTIGLNSCAALDDSVADPDPGSGIGCFLTPGSGIRDPE